MLGLLLFSSCHAGSDNSSEPHVAGACVEQYDAHLQQLADTFQPNDLALTNSLAFNPQLVQFLDTVDHRCLQHHSKYKAFLAVVLLKQYRYHLTHFHQGYDLLPMRTAGAALLINDFIHVARLDGSPLEMLNSGYVVIYSRADAELRTNARVMHLLAAIDSTEQHLAY